MRIISKGCSVIGDLKLLDNSGKPLDLRFKRIEIIMDADNPIIVAKAEIIVTEIDLNCVDIEQLKTTEGIDLTQELINSFYIRRNSEYFIRRKYCILK